MEDKYKLWILNMIISQLRNKNGKQVHTNSEIWIYYFPNHEPVMENNYKLKRKPEYMQ